MILVLDLGNTNLYVGVYRDEKLIKEYRTYSDINRSADGYRVILEGFLKQNNLDFSAFEGAILSSVIPSLTSVIVEAVETILNCKCLVVGRKIKSGLPIRIDNPSELGADLVCDSVGAIKKYGNGLLIVDLGTANKLLVIDRQGNFQGCVITPGIKVGSKALVNNTAQLIDISYTKPEHIIGKNSPDSLNSGAIYGTIAQIEGLSSMIKKEIGYDLKMILTGGNANLISRELVNYGYIFDRSLILTGLFEIYKKNKEN